MYRLFVTKQQKTVLRKIRRDNDWTIDFVSLKTGIDHATYSLVERKLKTPSPRVRERLEKFYKRPIVELLAVAA